MMLEVMRRAFISFPEITILTSEMTHGILGWGCALTHLFIGSGLYICPPRETVVPAVCFFYAMRVPIFCAIKTIYDYKEGGRREILQTLKKTYNLMP